LLISSEVKELWIFSNTGITLFNQRFDQQEDPMKAQLIGGLLSAIHSFSQQLDIGTFKCINFGDLRICFVFSKECSLIFVGLMNQSVKEKKSVEIMTLIKNAFVDMFKDQIKGNDACFDVSIFETAKDRINIKLNEWLGVSLKSDQSKKLLKML
jgi:hypothetical protein